MWQRSQDRSGFPDEAVPAARAMARALALAGDRAAARARLSEVVTSIEQLQAAGELAQRDRADLRELRSDLARLGR
jgi:hypothetical protein